jgi:uncharacterized membrane protein
VSAVARKVVAFVVIAALTNVAAVAALPRVINVVVMHQIAKQAGGENRALVAPRPDADARGVVRPSPDMLYTACVFDVSERPLRITAPVPDSYVSISGFAADTTNFFALNDAHFPAGANGERILDVILAREPLPASHAGARVVIAPSSRGLVLFRSLITSETGLPRLRDEFQAHQKCEPYRP